MEPERKVVLTVIGVFCVGLLLGGAIIGGYYQFNQPNQVTEKTVYKVVEGEKRGIPVSITLSDSLKNYNYPITVRFRGNHIQYEVIVPSNQTFFVGLERNTEYTMSIESGNASRTVKTLNISENRSRIDFELNPPPN